MSDQLFRRGAVRVGRLTALLFLFLLLPLAAMAQTTPQLRPVAPASPPTFSPIVQEMGEGYSAGSVMGGSLTGFTGLPASFLLGHAYNYAVMGPMQLDLGTFLGLYDSLWLLRVVPGIRYDFILPELGVVPYGKAGLAVDWMHGEAAHAHSLAVGVRLAAGVRHFITPWLGFGAELGLTLGTAAGDSTEAAFGIEGMAAFEYRLE